MKNVDFLDELGELALGSRLKRLSDRLLADAAQVYKNCGHDIQPKWFPLLALLWKHKQVSIVEAAEKLGLTQPAISQFIKELVGVGLVTSTPSPQDSRRKLIVLTEQGKLAIANMQRMWNAVDEAAKSLCDESGTAFYETVQNFEKALANKSLAQRTKEQLSYHVANPDVEFLAYSAELAPHFKSINAEWIEDMFVMEASDEEILNDPGRVVIEQGGKIYFAKHRTLGVVGTCALLKKDDSSYELTKMGVLAKSRGEKIGEALLGHVIEEASRLKIENLYLLTNKKCQAAIHLYLKAGFRHDQSTMENYGSKYQRCDVAMRYCKN